MLTHAVGLQAAIVSADSSAELPTSGGFTARTADDRANGLANNVLTLPPAAPLADVGLFIDTSAALLTREAQTKCLFGPWGGPFGGPWGRPGW